MLKELFKFILFINPIAFLSGIRFILFDNQEIDACFYDVKTRRKKTKSVTKKQITNYLEECYKDDN